MPRIIMCMLLALTLTAVAGQAAWAADAQQERGAYLVRMGACTDCHTPGALLGRPDNERFLGGSNVGFAIPGHGVFVGPNLTSDKETGLGGWSVQQVVTALTTGVRPDGRILAPVMPWQNYAGLTQADALAIAVYLKSLRPVSNKVPGPFGPDEVPQVLVQTIVPGEVYARMAR